MHLLASLLLHAKRGRNLLQLGGGDVGSPRLGQFARVLAQELIALLLKLRNLAVRHVQAVWLMRLHHTHRSRGFIEQIDRLIRQLASGDVARG